MGHERITQKMQSIPSLIGLDVYWCVNYWHSWKIIHLGIIDGNINYPLKNHKNEIYSIVYYKRDEAVCKLDFFF